MNKPRTADAYLRVSRRAGREGESFISPEMQRKKIADWAKLHEVEILAWWEEIDQSGAKLERPLFQQALARCEAGETGGIVVAKLDRFARSAVDALGAIRRLNDAGARLVSVEDNFDGSTPMGRFAIGILTLIAELELERIKESWTAAVSGAVERGVHISARPPTGYLRDENGRLIRDEPAASAVAELFRRRAGGASFRSLASWLDEQGIRPPTGNPHWSTSGVRQLLHNPVYLGQARSGKYVLEGAHEPLVSRADFDAAQATRTLLKAREGSIAGQALLGGLIRCAGCDHTLKIAGNTSKKTGERYPVYYCTGRYATGLCPARATIRASYVDQYVEEQVLAGNPKLLSMLGEQKFLEGVEVRQRELDEARQRLAELRSQSALASGLADGDLLEAWPTLDLPERRRLLHGLLDRVVLRRADGRAKSGVPPAERTQIVLRGNELLEPGRA